MKTSKKSLLLILSSFAVATGFAQVKLGMTNTTAVSKSVNAAATRNAVRSTTHVATKASAQAAANFGNNAKTTSAFTARKAADVKTTAHSVLNKSTKTTTDATAALKKSANTNARMKTQASVHASEQATANANENSAVFGVKTDASAETNTGVKVNGKPITEKAGGTSADLSTGTNAKKEKVIETRREIKAKSLKTKKETKAALRAKAKATEKAGENIDKKSAVLETATEVSTRNEIKVSSTTE